MITELLNNDTRLQALTSGQFRVLVMLVHLMSNNAGSDSVTISIADLQTAIGLHSSPLRRYLHALVRIGIVERIEQFAENGAQLTNRYAYIAEVRS